MDDFPGILARDFGFKPQGKSAPMAPSRNNNNNNNNNNSSGFSSVNFGLGSGGAVNSRSSSASTKSAPIFDDHDRDGGSDGLLFNDVFGGPPKYTESSGVGGGGTTSSSSAFDYDSIFKEQNAKAASLPVFDKPLYDDDVFDGLPGLKTTSTGSQSVKFDNVFATMGSPASPKRRSLNNSSPFDDLLGNLGRKEAQFRREASKTETDSAAFDDLLPGFGRSSSPSISRSTSESSQAQKPSANSGKTASSVMEDPFVVLESSSAPAASSGGLYSDPLEEIGRFSGSGSAKVDTSSKNMGAFDDIDAFDNRGKSVPSVSAGINKRGNDRGPLRTGSSMSDTYSPASKDPVDKHPVDEAEGRTHQMLNDDFLESHQILFDVPAASTDIHRSTGQNASSPSYVNASPRDANSPPRSEDISDSFNDIWLTVSEVPLYTQPTSAPPPSRPPPPRPPRMSKSEAGSFSSTSRKVNEYSFSNSASYSQSPRSSHAARGSAPTQMDELEDFAMGRSQNSANEHVDVLYGEDFDANASSAAASAAAMKEAMDKAEAKFKQMREREYLKAARGREAGQPDRDVLEAQQRELRDRHGRLDRERQQREREEEEREQRRLERERERTREIEREREEKEREQRKLERERERTREIEREREKARQAVERATREARERAAVEARQRAERAAVEKASAEARERAERAAVQRAQAEARERAAAEARERAEKAAAEARERANAEARERDARERAAVARAESDARQRAERAAVERAAAEARERAAAAARANQQKNDNDLESFFSSRASSAPRPRANPSDPFFENKGGSETAKRTSVGTTSSMKKASSTTNIVDDLSSIFGATGTTGGEFPEVEGETEERRKARLERHQRTQERAAKALAEKNQRDLQAQREQAERHRIAETLDAEIKRWAAGKEGNLRALLSTLQYVLWPECGWQPVSLTDLITGASVKKVYRKATLCIHPDKVQQKGANLQQKYIAEKVFDLLKEAWNKFNSEELF